MEPAFELMISKLVARLAPLRDRALDVLITPAMSRDRFDALLQRSDIEVRVGIGQLHLLDSLDEKQARRPSSAMTCGWRE
jgi:hypothetical protein